MNIRKIIKEEINDFDWIEEHEFSQDEVIQHIKDNNITEWTFGEHWDGDLDLRETPITNLGNLQSVGGYLFLRGVPITSLGNLQSVGGGLNLEETPISKTYSEEQIRQSVQVDGVIYM
jgi:hypothetical protein